MSKTFWNEDGTATEGIQIDDMNKCKWLCDEVCCNEKCDCLGDYPYPLKCDNKDVCGCFEKEDGIIGDE